MSLFCSHNLKRFHFRRQRQADVKDKKFGFGGKKNVLLSLVSNFEKISDLHSYFYLFFILAMNNFI